MNKKITERQRKIYEFIRDSVDKQGIPPTLREIGEKFGIRSTNGVERHLSALERSGMIVRRRGKSRGISLHDGERSSVLVPLLGRVSAGTPLLAPENREDEIKVDPALFNFSPAQDLFALRVRGDSMVDAHIVDGDIVLVRSQPHARNGDIVVAFVDGEATIKRLFSEQGRVRLQPENSAMRPIIVDRGDLRILGKAIGVIRSV